MRSAFTENRSASTVNIWRIDDRSTLDTKDLVATEEPLAIRLQYQHEGKSVTKNLAVTMRTPGHDAELATGFLFTEGIIKGAHEIQAVHSSDEQNILVQLTDNTNPSLQTSDRNFYTTSSCGVCGKSSIDSVRTVSAYSRVPDSIRVEAHALYGLHQKLRNEQEIFESTGGLHASALFDLGYNLIMLREDVGRHNALDKIIGASLMARLFPLSDNILLLSGRASFELIQKAAMAGIKVVAAVGAPSSLAVQLAEEFDMTLVGFLRGERFNVYSASKRIFSGSPHVNTETQRPQG